MNHAGGIDSDGGCRGGTAGEIVCEEQQAGRGEHSPAREEAGTGRQAEIHFREQGMGQRLLDRLVIWRGGEKRESDFRMAQEACCCAEERKNRRLNHRRVMRVSMMPIFALQVLREDGVEDSAVVMTGYPMMLIRVGVDMDQRDREHPEDQPEDRNDTKPTHIQPHRLSGTLDSHLYG